MKRALFIGASALLCGLVLQAATLEQLSLEDMVRKSSAIVRARVAGSYAALNRDVIYTHYELQVLDRWKGPEAARLDVVLPGGVAGGRRQTFAGAPQLAPGQEYVLFLWTGPSGRTHVIGLSQGVFDVKRGDDGEIQAFRGANADLMLDRAGRPVRDVAMTLRLGDFRQRVTRIMGRPGAAR
ncbi:MAG TPA: hypothetical protein VN428_15520 [Bryobacteraceae bacterium]|nr:hypothetical protein [Bryobacteraceae bacterium]